MSGAAFAVTTRSRLRSIRFFPPMLLSSRRIRRQLARTPGCVRFASIVAGPREFWTITVWESRDKMLAFMRSGEHEDIMWQFGKWLSSFWLMRWRPTESERGAWAMMRLSRPAQRRGTQRALSPQEQAAYDAALEALPHLKDSIGPEGAPTYEASQRARRDRQAVAGGAAVMARVAVDSLRQAPGAWRDLRRLRKRLGELPEASRWVSGIAGLREFYLLAVLSDAAACDDFLADPAHEDLDEQWGESYWAMAWEPANEFGHWDGFRLRQERARAAIEMPERAARVTREE